MGVATFLSLYRVKSEFTDHHPLVFLSRMYNHNQRPMRWSLIIQNYVLDISHKKGSENFVAHSPVLYRYVTKPQVWFLKGGGVTCQEVWLCFYVSKAVTLSVQQSA